MYLKEIKGELKQLELDLEFKLNEKLADDVTVRKQPSIDDRRALAMMMLSDEFQKISELKVIIMDVDESVKLIKTKYDQLKTTMNDIKFQRALVKDDIEEKGINGSGGYSSPMRTFDKLTSDNLPTTIKVIDPRDLIDPGKRPEELPVPIDNMHANLIAEFLNKPSSYPNIAKVMSTELRASMGMEKLIDEEREKLIEEVNEQKKSEDKVNDQPVKMKEIISYDDLI
jgi:hypothetical protein